MRSSEDLNGARAPGVRDLRGAATIVWPLQATAAATLAWVIAKEGLGHEDPFFASIAAVIALSTSLGERGLNALRLVQGVKWESSRVSRRANRGRSGCRVSCRQVASLS